MFENISVLVTLTEFILILKYLN